MIRVVGACAMTFLIMLAVPFPFYAAFEALGIVEMPEGASPAEFMLSVVVMKIGIAVGFVLLYRFSASAWQGRLWKYAAIWWVMYAVVEIGQGVGPGYGPGDAVAGMLAEGVYFPLSAWSTARILGNAREAT